MMHDFAASHTHTILLDMPLTLDALNLMRGQPVVSFNAASPSRFGVLPRHAPELVKWYTAPSCIIFHTALAFNLIDEATGVDEVNLVCCRLNSSRLVYAAGNVAHPLSQQLPPGQTDSCLLYYYSFPLAAAPDDTPPASLVPLHAFPLCSIPFEFPTVPHARSMLDAQYVYGCSMRQGSFSVALGSAAKIDCLVKVAVQRLIARGRRGGNGAEQAVDERTMQDILDEQATSGQEGDVAVFVLPDGWYAQECSFVPRKDAVHEDDGYLLT